MSDLGESPWRDRRPVVCFATEAEVLRRWRERHPAQAERERVYAEAARMGRIRDQERVSRAGHVPWYRGGAA